MTGPAKDEGLRRSEEALRESEARFRGIFENAGVGIALFDTDGKRLRANQAYCDLFGYSLEELLQRSIVDLLHPEDTDRAQRFKRFTDVLANGGPGYSVERRFLRKDGSTVWHHVTVSVQRDEAGKPMFAISVIQNITARKQLEVELVKARQVAEAANHAKDEFLANVSHELRTPMTAILGMTELVLNGELEAGQRRNLEVVRAATDHMLKMIGELLDFSKMGAGKVELEKATFSLGAAMGAAGRAMAVRAQRRGLALAFEVDPAVPDALVGDRGRLQQVLVNLVDNGIKFTERGEVVVNARLSERHDAVRGVGIRFDVSDTGIGIQPDRQRRIFQPFEQEDNSITKRYGGTGLGLSIASQLVALMGGELTVQSVPGEGSTFSFTAWFGRATDEGDRGAEAPQVEDAPPPAANFGRTLKVLVAEDNAFNAQFLEVLLEHGGHDVRVARDGREALMMAETRRFDLMLLDIHMPKMGGLEVIARLRAGEAGRARRLPVIALTARARPDDRERCLAAGTDAFLTKPVRACDLWDAIAKVAPGRDAAPTAPSPSPIDARVLLAACAGEPEILRKICAALSSRLPSELRQLRAVLDVGDASGLREAAHRTYGMAAAFSTEAGNLLSEIEEKAERADLERMSQLLTRLEVTCAAVLRAAPNLTVAGLRRDAGEQQVATF